MYIPPLRQGNPGPGAVQVGLRPSVVVRKGYSDSAAGLSAFLKGCGHTWCPITDAFRGGVLLIVHGLVSICPSQGVKG